MLSKDKKNIPDTDTLSLFGLNKKDKENKENDLSEKVEGVHKDINLNPFLKNQSEKIEEKHIFNPFLKNQSEKVESERKGMNSNPFLKNKGQGEQLEIKSNPFLVNKPKEKSDVAIPEVKPYIHNMFQMEEEKILPDQILASNTNVKKEES